MKIDRCVCKNKLFSVLRSKAEAESLALGELMAQTEAGQGCGMCVPYLCRMMRTGQAVFNQIVTLEDEACGAVQIGEIECSRDSC